MAQDNRGQMQSVEGVMKDLCLKLGCEQAQHIHAASTEDRCRELARLAIKALSRLIGEGDGNPAWAADRSILKGGKMSPAQEAKLSMEAGEEEKATSALMRGMGVREGRYA